MTRSHETMTDSTRRGHDAMTSVMHSWLDMFVPVSDTKLRGAFKAVDNLYDFAEQVLVAQREFTKDCLAYYQSVASKAAYAAQDAAKDVDYAAKDMEDGVSSQRQMNRSPGSAKDTDAALKKS